MSTTYITLVNDLLRRINEVTLDTSGDGFATVKNVQAYFKMGISFPFLNQQNLKHLQQVQEHMIFLLIWQVLIGIHFI